MDIATLLGFAAGILAVAFAVFRGSSPVAFFDIPSLILVLGGTFAATLIKFTFRQLLYAFRLSGMVFHHHTDSPRSLIQLTEELSDISRRQGLLALEDVMVTNPFYRKGLEFLVDGRPIEDIEHILREDMMLDLEQHAIGAQVFQAMGESAPAFGMIGTVTGLVHMMLNLEDPKKIGYGMALAILTTFYGLILAYLIFLPIAEKIELRHEAERLNQELVLEALVLLAKKEHPRIIREVLHSFLPGMKPVSVTPSEEVSSEGTAEK